MPVHGMQGGADQHNPLLGYIVSALMSSLGVYVVYDIGKEYGWWAYPTPDELLCMINETTSNIASYRDLIDAFFTANDPVKEDALFIMARRPQYVLEMQFVLTNIHRLLTKTEGRLERMRAAEVHDDAMIATLEDHLATLRVQAHIFEQLVAHSETHKNYFKLFKLEQQCINMHARELQIFEQHQHDAQLESAIITYGLYAYGQRKFGLLYLRAQLNASYNEYLRLILENAHMYPRIEERLHAYVATLRTVEMVLMASDAYVAQQAMYDKLQDQSSE
jgi:hypothetical protein